jgi:hypothetical protein
MSDEEGRGASSLIAHCSSLFERSFLDQSANRLDRFGEPPVLGEREPR